MVLGVRLQGQFLNTLCLNRVMVVNEVLMTNKTPMDNVVSLDDVPLTDELEGATVIEAMEEYQSVVRLPILLDPVHRLHPHFYTETLTMAVSNSKHPSLNRYHQFPRTAMSSNSFSSRCRETTKT